MSATAEAAETAARLGDTYTLLTMLDAGIIDLHTAYYGWPLLECAVQRRQEDTACALIKRGAVFTMTDFSGLHHIAVWHKPSMFDFIIRIFGKQCLHTRYQQRYEFFHANGTVLEQLYWRHCKYAVAKMARALQETGLCVPSPNTARHSGH